MPGDKKTFAIQLQDFSGGVNGVEHPIVINANQVNPSSLGCILKKSGFVKYPGSLGISATDTFTKHLRMLDFYRKYDTTELLLALSNGTLSSVSLVDGSLTSLFTMGSETSPGWMCEAFNKAFVCNGNKVVKVESTTAYQVGITAPAGVTAAASAGAGLPDGVYEIYASYARRVSGSNVLYSQGLLVGSVTLGTGNNRINITAFPNSADAQVGNKILWIKSPGETVHYFFYETMDNTTTTFIVSSTAAKNTSLVYEVNALNNGTPPAGTFIYSFADRLWLIKDNTIYYSAKGYTEYDLEVFPAANFRTTPYMLTGIFSVGDHLYFNTESGILALPNADISAIAYLIEPRWHFKYMRTVARWNNGVIGLTNDGVRFFDGSKFSATDLSYFIKSDIDNLYSFADSNFGPCGWCYRRSMRNEYHLTWYDTTLNAVTNSRHAILNLDTCNAIGSDSVIVPDQLSAAWEFHQVSGNFAAISRNANAIYIGQSHATAPRIYHEDADSSYSKYVYDSTGAILTEDTALRVYLQSKEVMPKLDGKIWIKKVYVLSQNSSPFVFRFSIGDRDNCFSKDFTIPGGGSGGLNWDSGKWDQDTWPSGSASKTRMNGHDGLWGTTVFFEAWQEENDPTFKLLSVVMVMELETGNFI
jgi:hypothetical protein